MGNFTRRAVLAALGASVAAGAAAYAARFVGFPALRIRLADGGMMGASPADMSLYMDMFNRHTEITRTVEEIPGGVRTTTQSGSPDLAAQLHAHVSSMYSHLDQGTEVMCMSRSLPTLFRSAGGYRRQLTLTPTGVIAEETSADPAITDAIRAHAAEVTGFVQDGMPAMMRGMMGGAMGPGCMGGRGGMMRPGGSP
ncbi:hypothetical protein [Mycobacterium parmense]|uniref:Uncharacterized protein n=1 Tax=Mycobacterium parmense TaxID=185642 RepID=A0A7I7YW93_9MYCO|nr:hypothetical protein [Mycobacterium parmense]MCV7351301.1 hypothetical protein [Mycobacterium parmense]ORW60828.1 hypothetical protein AWC20_07785 [Mycobacterium parmense]BBZ45244.1 hypothetical protein MPRM_25250 [Mycobacterium parmense]